MVLAWLAFAWLAGIAAGGAAALTVGQWLILGAIAVAAGVALRSGRGYRLFFAAVLTLCLGAARLRSAVPPLGPGAVASFNDTARSLVIEGVIVEPPDVRDRVTLLRVDVGRVLTPDAEAPREANGLVLVEAPRSSEWRYGDRVRARGLLGTPPEDEAFSYRDYLARQGIHSLMPDASVEVIGRRQANPLLQWLFDFRERARQALQANFPDPEASLLSGILLGAEGSISAEVKDAFNRTGTSHIIAISGFNISLIAGVFVSAFGRWLGARWGAVAAGAAILVYTMMVGASASVVRAALMGGLSLMALRLGRQPYGFASLGAAAFGMTLVNPLVLGDAGFQLSFAATLGLMLYGEPLRRWAEGRLARLVPPKRAARLAGPLAEFFLFTLAAQLTTLPLTIYYFQRLSLAALIANPVILPAQPAIMVLGGLSAVAGALWAPLGRPFAWLAWPFAAFTIRAVEFFAGLPAAAVPLGVTRLPTIGLLYLGLLGATILARVPAERRPRFLRSAASLATRISTGAALLGLALANIVTWSAAADRPDGRLRVTVLDVGAGDAVLIESPTGRQLLVDGGASPVALSDALGRRLSPWGGELDWVVLAATGEEQTAGLAGVLERFPVQSVLVGGRPGDAAYRQVIDQLEQKGCPVVQAAVGQSLELGADARLEVIASDARSSAFLLTFGRLRVLLAPVSDAGSAGSAELTRAIGLVDAVLLPESGDGDANPASWLQALHPWAALISVQAGNRAGHPSPETLAALAGTTVLRTDLNGWIELTSDGESLWVEVERVPR
jgi:competence protein ComEC